MKTIESFFKPKPSTSSTSLAASNITSDRPVLSTKASSEKRPRGEGNTINACYWKKGKVT